MKVHGLFMCIMVQRRGTRRPGQKWGCGLTGLGQRLNGEVSGIFRGNSTPELEDVGDLTASTMGEKIYDSFNRQ